MPYRSEKQRRFMHAKHPEIAARWDKEKGAKAAPKKRRGPGQASRTAAARRAEVAKNARAEQAMRKAVPSIGKLLKPKAPTRPPGGPKPLKRGMTKAAAKSPAKVAAGRKQIEDRRRKKPLPRPPGRGPLR